MFDGEKVWVASNTTHVAAVLNKDWQPVAIIAPGSAPIDMFSDGEYPCGANAHADTVTKISVDGDVVGVYDVLIAFTSDGENIWVANWRENTLSKVGPDGADLGKFPVVMLAFDFILDRLGELPLTLTVDGERVWIAKSGHGTVSRKQLDGRYHWNISRGVWPSERRLRRRIAMSDKHRRRHYFQADFTVAPQSRPVCLTLGSPIIQCQAPPTHNGGVTFR